MNLRPNWQADCPKCAASKFTCDEHYRPEIECPECEGNGWVGKRLPRLGGGVHEVNCEHCNGHGWRPMTDDELDAAAERQEQDRYEAFHDGGGSLSLNEQHASAWQQKQELRR